MVLGQGGKGGLSATHGRKKVKEPGTNLPVHHIVVQSCQHCTNNYATFASSITMHFYQHKHCLAALSAAHQHYSCCVAVAAFGDLQGPLIRFEDIWRGCPGRMEQIAGVVPFIVLDHGTSNTVCKCCHLGKAPAGAVQQPKALDSRYAWQHSSCCMRHTLMQHTSSICSAVSLGSLGLVVFNRSFLSSSTLFLANSGLMSGLLSSLNRTSTLGRFEPLNGRLGHSGARRPPQATLHLVAIMYATANGRYRADQYDLVAHFCVSLKHKIIRVTVISPQTFKHIYLPREPHTDAHAVTCCDVSLPKSVVVRNLSSRSDAVTGNGPLFC